MNEEQIKALLSQSFLATIGHRGGFLCHKPEPDFGVDLTVSRVEEIVEGNKRRFLQTGESVDFQLKCTTQAGVEFDAADDVWKYDLSAKNYNDLVRRRIDFPPLYLMLYVLPVDPEAWLRSNANLDELILAGRGYWYLPAEDAVPTENAQTQRIYVPGAQAIAVGFFGQLFINIYG